MLSRQTVLNGVALPNEFIGGNIINNIAISKDGSKYAVVGKDKQLIMGDVPEDGVIEVNGLEMVIKRGGGICVSSGCRGSTVISGGSSGGVVISSGSISISGGASRGEEIDQRYSQISDVIIQTNDADLIFRTHDCNLVMVEGVAEKKPTARSGILDLGDFDGIVTLPKSDVRVTAKTMSGDINGEISVPGNLNTMSGDISLKIRGQIAVRTQTMSGDIDVRGMIGAGRNTFSPPIGKAVGKVSLKTMSGDITVRYIVS